MCERKCDKQGVHKNMEKQNRIDEAGRLDVKPPGIDEILDKKKPEKTFRVGSISATIWLNARKDNDGNLSHFRTIGFERGYKDKDGEWQSSSSLRVGDLPKARLVLDKAYEYIMLKESNGDQ